MKQRRAELERRIASHEQTAAFWLASNSPGMAGKSLRAIERRREELAALKHGDKGGNMDREGWQVFQGFKSGDHVYCRGDYLPLETGLLLREELRSSYLRRALIPPDWTPRRRATPAVQASFTLPDVPSWVTAMASRAQPADWSWRYAAAVHDIMNRGRDFAAACDLADRNLYAHAVKEFAAARGTGTYRRPVDHFFSFILAIVVRMKIKQAA